MNLELWMGIAAGALTPIVLWKLHHWVTVEVEEYSTVVMTKFGKWERQFDEAGEYMVFSKLLPWVRLHTVSRQVRSQTFEHISIHDIDGTSLQVDLWVEFQIKDPRKVLFSVEDWRDAMKSAILSSTTNALGGISFMEILKNRSTLEQSILDDLRVEFARWGISLSQAMIQNIALLPEVNRQILQGVAAHLEKKQALLVEEARMKALKIEAITESEMAEIKAEAASQKALAVGRAFEQLKSDAVVFDAYEKLYGLSLYHPSQMVVFEGFKDDFRSSDASLFLNGNAAKEKQTTSAPARH